ARHRAGRPGGAAVLRVAKLGRGGHDYYLEVAAGPGGTGVEAAGRWVGRGSGAFGLEGTVDGDALGALLRGDDPGGGGRLGPSHDRVTVAGFDLSFCAPKSVSLLEALGPPEVATEVRAAHDTAVGAALDYVERRALAVRRRHDGVPVPVEVEAVAGAGFVHRTSRALDPHLHTHVVLANLGRDRQGRYSALDGRGVYAHAGAADALYHVQLRHELTSRLGVGWGPLRRGRADVAGIGPEVRAAFSRRSAAIAAHLAQRGLEGPRANAIAGHATRPDRDPTRSADELRPGWARRARAAGLSPARLEGVLDRVARAEPGWPGDGVTAVAAGLARRGGTVTRRDVVRQACTLATAGAPAARVEAAADGLMASWPAVEAHAGRGPGTGVGERRHVVDGPEVGQDLGTLLARRGLSVPGPRRRRDLAPGMDLGMGLG
ncbi:MAG TPA: MobF family relaxase, partial [Acidimicrobiales bacterium]|nr:MobF family relaxase [Acidimicrobiales bacterium]